jgi:hypothetical protein
MNEVVRDIFICHASEDKKEIVGPIVQAFTQSGISVWYDEAEIKWGDSITQKVNEGLRISRFVIVVLSPSFAKKNWPQRELNTALNIEASTGEVKVLPLLVGSEMEKREILDKYPLLSDKKYLAWIGTPQEIVQEMNNRLSKLGIANRQSRKIPPIPGNKNAYIYPKKYWWLVVMVVPIIVALIYQIPSFLKKDSNIPSSGSRNSQLQKIPSLPDASDSQIQNKKPTTMANAETTQSSKKIQKDNPNKDSESNTINNLPLDKKIILTKRPKETYMYKCPDFQPDALDHFGWLSDCEINKFGSLGSINDRAFYFGLYTFSRQEVDYLSQGVIVFEGKITDMYIKPCIFKVHLDIFPKAAILGYSEPRIFDTKFGKILVLSCALGGGSSIAYDNNYYLWENSNWVEIDSKKWELELKGKLPKGLSIWDQPEIDFNDLTIASNLWTEKDPHCCPTGGKVKIYLSIKENRFEIDKVNIGN